MNTPNQLDQALEALRQEHRSIQPPLTLEASIMRQAELATPRHAHTLRNWSLATAAALAIALVLLYPRPSHPTLQTNITTTTSPVSPDCTDALDRCYSPRTTGTPARELAATPNRTSS
jgi:hypothetical protein